jgi:hypothetical protein
MDLPVKVSHSVIPANPGFRGALRFPGMTISSFFLEEFCRRFKGNNFKKIDFSFDFFLRLSLE